MPVEFRTLRSWFRASHAFTDDWRTDIKALSEFVAGNQWSAEDAAKLREDNRPAVVFNRAEVIIDAIAGAEMNNRHETSYRPVEINDSGIAEVMTSAVVWARHRCQADDEESDAFRDMVIGGVGCTRTGPDYDGDRPEIVVERVDPAEVVWDHRAKKRNLRDRRYTFRARRIDAMTAEETWPEKDIDDVHAHWAEQIVPTTDHSGLPGRAYEAGSSISPSSGSKERKDVVIVEAEWWERETSHQVIAMGQVIEVDGDQLGVLKKRLEMLGQPYQVNKQRRKVYYRAIMGREEFIEKNKMDPQKGGFRFKFMTAKRERHEDGYLWYGVARSMKDPQMWANKFLSQVLHIINSSALGRILFESDAVRDPRKAQQLWYKPNAWVELEPNALSQNKIIEAQQPPIPANIVTMLEFAIGSIRECAGVNPELLGQTQREQAGVLEYQRRQAGMNVLAVLFDALTQYREEQGYLMMYMILTHMNDGRLIRVVGDQGEKYVPFMFEDEAPDFDIKVSEAPSAPDQKDKMWAAIQGMIPHLLSAGMMDPDFWADVVEYAPLPTPLAEKLAGRLRDMAKQPQGPTPEQQIAMRSAMAEIAKTESETAENRASAILDIAKAQQSAAETQIKGGQLQLDALDQLAQHAAMAGEPGALDQAAMAERQEGQKQAGAERQQARQLEAQLREGEASRRAQERLASTKPQSAG